MSENTKFQVQKLGCTLYLAASCTWVITVDLPRDTSHPIMNCSGTESKRQSFDRVIELKFFLERNNSIHFFPVKVTLLFEYCCIKWVKTEFSFLFVSKLFESNSWTVILFLLIYQALVLCFSKWITVGLNIWTWLLSSWPFELLLCLFEMVSSALKLHCKFCTKHQHMYILLCFQ